jgi:quercetin dioxygenase-like cupin family protein
MPRYFLTGVGDDGRSRVVERRELTLEMPTFHAFRNDQPVPELDQPDTEAILLEQLYQPGAAWCAFVTWRPGQYTDIHRTTSVDFDAVVLGSVELALEAESVWLEPGDCVCLPGSAHGWRAGPDGAMVAHVIMEGSAPARDADRVRQPSASIVHNAGGRA